VTGWLANLLLDGRFVSWGLQPTYTRGDSDGKTSCIEGDRDLWITVLIFSGTMELIP